MRAKGVGWLEKGSILLCEKVSRLCFGIISTKTGEEYETKKTTLIL